MSNTKTPVNSFKKENEYYKLVTHTGRPKRYATPEDLWEAAIGYFTWCSTTPVITYRHRHGKFITIFKNREMSLKELHKWLGICNLNYYKKLPLFTRKVHRIQNVIAQYNYVHAAVGLLKGRSVGHALRKEHYSLHTQNNPVRHVKPSAPLEISITIGGRNSCVTSPSPLERAGVRPHATPIKNTSVPPKAPLKKIRIDTRKVRILKQKLFLTKILLVKEMSFQFSSAGRRRFGLSRPEKYPVDTRKVRISPENFYSKDIFHPPEIIV